MTKTNLTPREIQCVFLAGSRGLSDDAIADRLKISSKRVGNYLRSAYDKTGHRNRRDAYLQGVLAPGVTIPGESEIIRETDWERPGPSPGDTTPDTRPWLARLWRAPPRSRLVILILIVGWAILAMTVILGGVAIARSVFDAVQEFAWSFTGG